MEKLNGSSIDQNFPIERFFLQITFCVILLSLFLFSKIRRMEKRLVFSVFFFNLIKSSCHKTIILNVLIIDKK